MDTEITVVSIYVIMVRIPIFDKLDISLRSDIPLMSAARINGMAINFKALMKIVPKGLTQSPISSEPQLNLVIIRAKTTSA